MRYTGVQARIGNVSKHVNASSLSEYNIELIGDVAEFEVRGQADVMTVPGLGNAYLSAIETARVRPELDITFHPQNTSYLHSYLIVQTGNNLTSHFVSYFANSADYGILWNGKPVRVEVTWAKNTPITVRANLIGTNWTMGLNTSAGNYLAAVSSTEPIMSEQMTVLKFRDGATWYRDMTDLWRRGSFTIDYKTVPVFTGTGIMPSDVLEGAREVRGMVEVSMNESATLMPYVINASVLNVEVGFGVAPMSTTYFFYSSRIRVISVTVPGTDFQRQRIEWNAKYITRSSL